MTASTVLALLALAVLGYAPARLVTGSSVFAILFAPVAAGVVLGGTVTVGLALRLPTWTSLLLAAIVSVACAVPLRLPRGAPIPESRVPLMFGAVAVLPVASLRRGPIEHDFRVIWSMHAKWVTAGGDVMADAMRNPAFAYAHPDYPPLAPAVIGATRWLTDTDSLRSAQVTVAVLTASAVCALAYSLWWTFRAAPRLAAGIGALVVLATFGAASATSELAAPGTNGYVDLLWAACFAAASTFFLVAPRGLAAIRLGTPCLAAAALGKHEGLTASVLLLFVVAVRYRHELRRVAWPAIALVPALAWLLVAAGLGATTAAADAPGNSRLLELLRLDPGVTGRIGPTLRAVWHYSWPFVVVAAVVTALTAWACGRNRSAWSGSRVPWSWAAWATTTGVILLAFVTSGSAEPPLASAPDRTSIAGNVLLLCEILVCGAIALGALRGRPGPETSARGQHAQAGHHDRARAVRGGEP